MALINCPECGREVSDKAAVCLNCGVSINSQAAVPLVQTVVAPAAQEKKRVQIGGFEKAKSGWVLAAIGIPFLIIVSIAYVIGKVPILGYISLAAIGVALSMYGIQTLNGSQFIHCPNCGESNAIFTDTKSTKCDRCKKLLVRKGDFFEVE